MKDYSDELSKAINRENRLREIAQGIYIRNCGMLPAECFAAAETFLQMAERREREVRGGGK